MPEFIEKDFSYYNLPLFEEFKNLINKCVVEDDLYKLIPYLLRNLFENLLYFIL